jgi:HSP20 family protein
VLCGVVIRQLFGTAIAYIQIEDGKGCKIELIQSTMQEVTMFITKCNPGMRSIWDAFDRELFPVMRRLSDDQEENFRLPKTNINEGEKDFILTLEIPGVSKKDVEISVDGETLTITAKRSEEIETDGLLRSEIRSEKFKRTFQIGSQVDREKIAAKMENGILKLTMPKMAEVLGRKIDIS